MIHCVVGRVCGEDVRAARELRTLLPQVTHSIPRKKNKELLAGTLASEVEQCMTRAAVHLQATRLSDAEMPSADQVVRAAAAVANKLYTTVRSSLGNNAEMQKLETSHAKFTEYLQNPNEVTALGGSLN